MEIKINLLVAVYFLVNSWLSGLSYSACREGDDSVLKSSLVALLFFAFGIVLGLAEIAVRFWKKFLIATQIKFFYKLYTGKLSREWKNEEQKNNSLQVLNDALLDDGVMGKKISARVRRFMKSELNRVSKFNPLQK